MWIEWIQLNVYVDLASLSWNWFELSVPLLLFLLLSLRRSNWCVTLRFPDPGLFMFQSMPSPPNTRPSNESWNAHINTLAWCHRCHRTNFSRYHKSAYPSYLGTLLDWPVKYSSTASPRATFYPAFLTFHAADPLHHLPHTTESATTYSTFVIYIPRSHFRPRAWSRILSSDIFLSHTDTLFTYPKKTNKSSKRYQAVWRTKSTTSKMTTQLPFKVGQPFLNLKLVIWDVQIYI